jgi:hypothetical protein
MRKAWLWTGVLAAATSAACHRAPVETGATPSSGKTRGSTPASAGQCVADRCATAEALYVVDGVIVESPPGYWIRSARSLNASETPLYIIDGVIVAPSPKP